jgi:hypothetical protein
VDIRYALIVALKILRGRAYLSRYTCAWTVARYIGTWGFISALCGEFGSYRLSVLVSRSVVGRRSPIRTSWSLYKSTRDALSENPEYGRLVVE